MVFITVLLFVFAYIFAIIGVIFFSAELYKHRKELAFWDSFRWVYLTKYVYFILFLLIFIHTMPSNVIALIGTNTFVCVVCVCMCFYVCVFTVTLCSSIPRALITLFQLFTLDHWMCIYKDVTKVSTQRLVTIYESFYSYHKIL